MASMKFHDKIGYGESVEDPPNSGVWKDVVTEYSYYGDIIRNARRLEDGEGLNDNISVGNSISVVADEYANQHFHAIRYITWLGVRWIVTNVEVRPPRLILDLGDVYNGPVAAPPEEEGGDGD